MNPCDLANNWQQIRDTSVGLTELAAMVNDQLSAWGYEPISFTDQPPTSDGFSVPGEYVAETKTIHMDPDFLAESDVADAMQIALHEGVHAMHHQDNMPDAERTSLTAEYEAGYIGGFLSEEARQKCKKRAESGGQRDTDSDFDADIASGEVDTINLEYPLQSTPTSAGKKAYDEIWE